MNISPIGDRVLLKKIKDEEKTINGIIITNSNKIKNKAILLDFGSGENVDILKKSLKVSDTVLFNSYEAEEIEESGEIFIIVYAKDIIAKVLEV